MITETRKQIIEIIEPYMDKTLSEGCLFTPYCGAKEFVKTSERLFGEGYIQEYTGIHTFRENKEYYIVRDLVFHPQHKKQIEGYKEIRITKLEVETSKLTKILGHYDITAVLKYIVQTRRNYDFDYKYIKVWGNDSWLIIPNKPLHLYSEKEEKDLLKLLLKLKK